MKKFALMLLLGNMLLGTALYAEEIVRTYGDITVTYDTVNGAVSISVSGGKTLFSGTMDSVSGNITLVNTSSGVPSGEPITISPVASASNTTVASGDTSTASVDGGEFTITSTPSGGTSTAPSTTFSFTTSSVTTITSAPTISGSITEVVTKPAYK